MGSSSLQNVYLRGLIVGEPTKRLGAQACLGKPAPGVTATRSLSYKYYVRSSKLSQKQVCRPAFISIYGITERRVKTVRSKACPIDQRGRHGNRPNKISDDDKNKVRAHIKSFPRQTSHYSREDDPNKRFLSEDLSVQRMHNLYLQLHEPAVLERKQEILRCEQENRFPVPPAISPNITLHMYREIFTGEFNLGFGLPRTDTCAECDALELAIKSEGSDKEALLEKKKDHHKEAGAGYQSKREDKKAAKASWEDKTRALGSATTLPRSKDAVDMITFDFQQNLPTPNLQHNDMFYARQLWTYNFGIHDCVANQGHMFMWDETTAKRGSSEVASCLQRFFTDFNSGARSLVSYSDGCTGQNKNQTIIGFYSELHNSGVYETLDHKFLVRGHTFLENDTDFSQIEKRKKSALVYLPEDWFRIVHETSHKKPFLVTEMKRDNFLDWKSHIQARYKPMCKDRDGQRVYLRHVHWLNFGWGEETNPHTGEQQLYHHADEVWVRYGFSTDEPWKKMKIKRAVQPQPAAPKKLYTAPVSVKAAKIKDLKKMAEKFIPEPQRQFYLRMGDSNPSEGDSTDDESDFE